MENKLTAQQLGRRLGTGTMMFFEKAGRSGLLNGVDFTNGTRITVGFVQNDLDYFHFKPCLRPLSQLTKEITVKGYNDGRPFVPLKMLEEIIIYNCSDIDVEDLEHLIRGAKTSNEINVSAIAYGIIQLLIQWHFVIDEPVGTYIEVTPEFDPYKL